mgnify:CR=1 FL=1
MPKYKTSEWVPLDGYEVSSDGRIRRNGKELKGTITKKGYIRVKIHNRATMLHRMIATAFLGKPEKNQQVNHKDGNKQNNNVENLEWCSPSENLLHAYRKLGRKAAFEGKHMPEWIRKKISESNKGRIITEDCKRRNSESHRGKHKGAENPHAMPVFCIETEKRYGSIKDAAEEFGFNVMSLYGAIRKNKKYKNKTFRKEK